MDAVKFATGVRRCHRPKMKCHAGRTWDRGTVLLPDGSKTDAYLDTTWGRNFYFRLPDPDSERADGQQWYRGSIDVFEVDNGRRYSLEFNVAPKPDRETNALQRATNGA